MPESFLEEMKKLLTEEEYRQLLLSYQKLPQKSIRLQLEKIDEKTWEQIAPFPVIKMKEITGGYFTTQEKLGNHPYHHAGLFYVQEPSAMLPPLLIDIPKNAKILDLCAAPGGKTLSLSNKVPDGFVISNEINYNRAKKLLSNVERLGLKNVVISSMSSKKLKTIYQEYFDVILIDAPCSGEGMFRKDEKSKTEWSKQKVEEMSQIGAYLLEDSALMLKKDGYLIYSTCTFSLKENEQQIVDFVKNHHFEIIDCPIFNTITKKGIKIEEYHTDYAKRCYPFLYGEGQFMIVLQKKEQHASLKINTNFQTLTIQEKKIVDVFLRENLKNHSYPIFKYQNNIVIIPSSNIEIPKMTLLACFVKMGEIIGNRFVPHHQFIKAYGNDFINQCYLKQDDDRITKYLKGEEIEAPAKDGYGVIMVDGYPLGLYKAKNCKLKNHYPKGLRYPL